MVHLSVRLHTGDLQVHFMAAEVRKYICSLKQEPKKKNLIIIIS